MSDKKDDKKKGGDKPKGDKPAGDKGGKKDDKGGKKDDKGGKKGDDKKGDKKGDDKKGGKGGDDKKGDKKGDDKKADKKPTDGGDKGKKDEPKADKKAAKADAGDSTDAAPAKADGGDDAKDSAAGADGGDEKKAVVNEPLDPQRALQQVLLTSLHNDGLARGLHESVKALDRREAHLCVLSSGCNEPAYVKLITALCSEHQIPLIKVEDSKQLGEWVGLCKRNSEQKAVKVVGCSCAVIRSWGEETEARQYIMDHIKAN